MSERRTIRRNHAFMATIHGLPSFVTSATRSRPPVASMGEMWHPADEVLDLGEDLLLSDDHPTTPHEDIDWDEVLDDE